jgi:hypothetical protein
MGYLRFVCIGNLNNFFSLFHLTLFTFKEDQEAKVDVDALQEPDVSKLTPTRPMTSKDWENIMEKVECYCRMLAKKVLP